jgi:hypothetical protein
MMMMLMMMMMMLLFLCARCNTKNPRGIHPVVLFYMDGVSRRHIIMPPTVLRRYNDT